MVSGISLQRTLLPYWILLITRRALFALPGLFLYLESCGINAAGVGWCLCGLAASQLIFEVPSGVSSDRLGRKGTLIIAATFRASAWILISVGSSFTTFLIGFVCLGAAFAFDSGTDSAFLYDTLQEHKQLEIYARYEARSHLVGLISLGLANLIGGFLQSFGSRVPIIATAIIMLVSILAGVFLKEPNFLRASSDRQFFSQVLQGLVKVRQDSSLKFVVFLTILLSVACEIYFRFIQQTLQFAKVISSEYFGYLYFVWLVVSALSAKLVRQVHNQKSVIPLLLMASTSLSLALLVIGLTSLPVIVLALCFIFQIVYGISPVLFRLNLNQKTDSTVRATILSVFGFLQSIGLVIFAPVIGMFAVSDPRYGMLALGGITLVFLLVGVARWCVLKK